MSSSSHLSRGLTGARFEGHVADAEIERAMRIILKDNTLALIRLDDGTFTIRLHDEVTPGGYPLVADPPPCPELPARGILSSW